MRSGGSSAGSGRVQRLDPFALPVRFAAIDAAADERVRQVELHRERVVMRRTLAGMRMALNLPVSAYRGVGLEVTACGGSARCAVVLVHKDPALELALYVAGDTDNALAEWRSWAAVLGLPLLISDADAGWRELFERMGALRIADPRPRRRRRSVLRKRRPSLLMRRQMGAEITIATPVHVDEREIIARD